MKTIELIGLAVEAGVNVLMTGDPGTGKTTATMQLANILGRHIEVVIASIREPSDFGGLPVVQDGHVTLAPPRWAQQLCKADKSVLFLDEITTAPPAVQAALLRVVLDRVVGDLELPASCSIVAACNPSEQAAGGWDLAPPLANRFAHLTWESDAVTWAEGVTQGWADPKIRRLPDGWEDEELATMALVSSFIRARQSLLCAVPKDEAAAGGAWPSPRSWCMAGRLMAAAKCAGYGADARYALVIASVGEAAGGEFLEWLDKLDLPDPEDVLRDPDAFAFPKRGDQAYAVMASVATAVLRKNTEPRWNAAWKFLARAVKEDRGDVATIAAQSLVKNRPANVTEWPETIDEFLPLLREAGVVNA